MKWLYNFAFMMLCWGVVVFGGIFFGVVMGYICFPNTTAACRGLFWLPLLGSVIMAFAGCLGIITLPAFARHSK